MSWNPIEQGDTADAALVGGMLTPGLCTVSAIQRPRRWDDRQSYGMNGATTVYRGLPLGTFTMELRLSKVEHWSQWNDFRRVIQPPTRRNEGALDVIHPVLAAASPPVASAVVLNVRGPEQSTPEGEWKVTIEWKEHRPAVAAPVGPVAASSPRTENNGDLYQQRLIAEAAGELAAESRAGGLL
ncbi:MAG: hypothetical protein J0L92_32735 [Deltaproteobacteria bacterium]|nr:hypothetical protein [Deltaproteobacteria bacterium]